MKRPIYLLFLLTLLIAGSCKQEKIKYRLFVSTDEPDGAISQAIKTVMERNHNVEIELVNAGGSFANLDSIADGVADIALIENFVPFRDDVRTILTFYPKVLHIFYQDNGGPEPQNFEELLYGKRVFIGEKGTGSHLFMEDMFEFFDLDRSKFTIANDVFSASTEVLIGFTDIVELKNLATLKGFKLYSLDQLDNYGKGSIVDAISLRFPQVHPFVIPETSYRDITDKPIVTVASDALLIVRAGLRESFAYDLTRTIFNEKQDFINLSPLIYTGLDENFDRTQISFPLHEGARVFLDRDEPGFFERYAELVGVLFSIAIAIVSALISLSKWQTQKKKDRVDIFYRELMEMKNTNFKTSAEGIEKIKGIQQSQNKAFDMLINEELEANESFRIYMELSKETIHEIRGRVKVLRNLNK
ncbi:MAG: TAXI family TRAP transporter solute-binding subunit [Cytophagales bacterium]|nr:TAXI family TRAP transporter solute-binding subunit [Cytophagales bacterium]